MRSQNAGRGGLLHAAYPHQIPWNVLHAVRMCSLLVPVTREDFSWVYRIRLHPGKMFPSRSDRIQTLPDCNSGCPRAADLTYQITIVMNACGRLAPRRAAARRAGDTSPALELLYHQKWRPFPL